MTTRPWSSARPENPPQRLEKVDSAPGIAAAAAVAARSGGLRDATRPGAPRPEDRALPLAASPSANRPQRPTAHLVLRSGAVGGASRRALQRAPASAPTGSPFETPASRSPQDEARGNTAPALGVTIARKNGRNALKKLILRPGLRQPQPSPRYQAGFATRGVGAPLDPRVERFRLPPRRATLARKIRRNALKRLILRPGLRQPALRAQARSVT